MLGDLFGGGKVKAQNVVLNPEVQKTKKFAMDNYRDSFGSLKDATTDFYNKDPSFLRAQIAREQGAVSSARQDAERKMKEMNARRGLGNSSIGIGAMMGINRDAAEKKAQIGATYGERARALGKEKLSGLQSILGATQPGMGLNVERAYTPESKKGSIFKDLAGAAVTGLGYSFGGPAGGALAGKFSSMFGDDKKKTA